VWGEVLASAMFEPELRDQLREASETWTDLVAGAIREGTEDGSISGDVDAHACAERLTALVDGLSSRWLAGSRDVRARPRAARGGDRRRAGLRDTQAMSRRRACLVVPAAPAAKLAKGATLAADEVVIDLEDAVVPAVKDEARGAVADALAGEWAAESVAVRVNAIGSPWCHLDLAALAASGRDALTAVLPKVEHPDDLAFADRLLDGAEAAAGRTTPVRLLALIETAAGLAAAAELARASERLDGLILGYADLAASLGRTGEQDWRYAQETVLVAARAAGIQAIDGPHLGIRDDDEFRAGVAQARTLGFDGKWAIHPAQLDALREAFTPTDDEIADAREVLAALDRAAADGAGAVADGDRMLDEALALSARRVLARAGR